MHVPASGAVGLVVVYLLAGAAWLQDKTEGWSPSGVRRTGRSLLLATKSRRRPAPRDYRQFCVYDAYRRAGGVSRAPSLARSHGRPLRWAPSPIAARIVTTKPAASVVVAVPVMTRVAPTDSEAITKINEISSRWMLSRSGMPVLRLRGKGLFLPRMTPEGCSASKGLQPVTAKHHQTPEFGGKCPVSGTAPGPRPPCWNIAAARKPVSLTVYERLADSPSVQLTVADAASLIDTAQLHTYRAANDLDHAAAVTRASTAISSVALCTGLLHSVRERWTAATTGTLTELADVSWFRAQGGRVGVAAAECRCPTWPGCP